MDLTNVLHVLYEPTHSGIAEHVLGLVRRLNAHKYRVSVACPEHSKVTIHELRAAAINVHLLPMHKYGNLRAAVALYRLCVQERVEVLHVHGQWAAMWSRPIAWLAGVRHIVYTPHTVEFKAGSRKYVLARPAYQLLERGLSSITELVVCVNDVDRRRLVEQHVAPRRKVITIPNGVAVPLRTTTDGSNVRRALGIADGIQVVAQIGRLAAQKGVGYFLDAAAIVLRTCPDTVFLVIGEGPQRRSLEAQANRLGIAHDVRFLGWRDDVSDLLGCLDVFALTSLWEGLPYALLEAMVRGIPVVATAVGGNAEVLEHGRNGILVPPADPAAAAAGITALLQDRGRAKEMGEQARRRVVNHFSIDVTVAKTEAAYDDLVASGRSLA